METVKVKGKDLLNLLESKVCEIKTTCGKAISKNNIDIHKLKKSIK